MIFVTKPGWGPWPSFAILERGPCRGASSSAPSAHWTRMYAHAEQVAITKYQGVNRLEVASSRQGC